MTREEMVDKLNSLIKVDVDASRAYGHAIEEIDAQDVRQQFTKYRSDHDRHITDLSHMVRELGGKPTEIAPDIKGYLLEGFTAIRSKIGTHGSLNAMLTNEKLTNKMYKDAMSWDLSQEAKSLIERNYGDEQRHLHYIEQKLLVRA
jgi:uncharacterized protein (TIGR02284 family)